MVTYKYSGKRNIESPADKLFKCLTRKTVHVSFFFPAVDLRFEIKSDDEEKRTVTMCIVGNLISQSYNKVEATLTVTPREDTKTSCLGYTFEFEKINNDIVPTRIVEALLTYILISNIDNIKKSKFNSIFVGHPAKECFKDFVNALRKNIDEVQIVGLDREKRIVTMNVTSAPFLGDSFVTIKVTATVTPKKDDNNRSRVKWTIEVEKINDNAQESDLFLFIACSVRETIMSKLRH